MLCYIRAMLLDSRLVPETIIKPRSFAGLMSMYESNYLRLLNLIPELERIDGCYRSRVAGECDLHLEILQRERYTLTMSMTYYFSNETEIVADPDMLVRVYFDGQLAEAMSLGKDHRHVQFRRLFRAHGNELGRRWTRNLILNKWLEYLLDQGHLILEQLA
ncbi:MAG: DUF1249 domain-containing protein [Gammaproteobacteria bacterium]|nr:MAG: DUF1249 domain-containing protein [Gammaproteobacteria bacterium]